MSFFKYAISKKYVIIIITNSQKIIKLCHFQICNQQKNMSSQSLSCHHKSAKIIKYVIFKYVINKKICHHILV